MCEHSPTVPDRLNDREAPRGAKEAAEPQRARIHRCRAPGGAVRPRIPNATAAASPGRHTADQHTLTTPRDPDLSRTQLQLRRCARLRRPHRCPPDRHLRPRGRPRGRRSDNRAHRRTAAAPYRNYRQSSHTAPNRGWNGALVEGTRTPQPHRMASINANRHSDSRAADRYPLQRRSRNGGSGWNSTARTSTRTQRQPSG